MRFRLPWAARPLPGAPRPALDRGEHVLSYAATRDGSYVVATDQALHIPAPTDGFLRVPWERVAQAAWRDGWLHVRENADTAGTAGTDRAADRAEHHIRLADPGSVPEIVQERVTATIVINHQATLPGGGHVRIVGRRPPRGEAVRWTFVFDAGLDPDDPVLRAQASDLLAALRRQTGL